MSILNVDKIQPIGGGSTITVDATDIQATSATITASKFVGSGDLSVTGVSTFTGNIDANGDLDVDGHTNLDNVSVAGVTTFTDAVRIVKTAGPLLELTTNTGAADATLRLSEGAIGSTTNGGGMFYSGADNKLYITCGTNSTTKRVTIKRDDGRVGINQTSPEAMLQVDYDYANSEVGLRLRAASGSGTKTWQLSEINGNAGVFTIRNATNGINALNINGSGYVGINTITPSKLLDVHLTNTNTYSSADSNTPANNSVISLTNKAGTDGSGSGYYTAIQFSIAHGANSTGWLSYHRTGDNQGDFTFKSRNTGSAYPELLRIRSNGRIGIGTGAPDQKIHAISHGNGNTVLKLSPGTTAGNYGGIELGRTDGSGNIRMTSVVKGGVPISGIPGIEFGTSDTNLPAISFATANSSNGHIAFKPKGTEEVRITADGDVAIGRETAQANYAAGSTTTRLAVTKDAAGSGYHEIAHFTAGSDSDDTGAIVRITQFSNDRGLYIKSGRGSSDQAKAIFGLRNSSAADQDVMVFQQGGYVTQPNRPYFKANKSSAITGTGVVVWNTVVYNNGGCYNNSNGRFTAPIAGLYWFSAKINAYDRCDFWLQKNGTRFERGQYNTDSNNVGWWSNQLTSIVEMTAGEYVEVNVTNLNQNTDPGEWITFMGYLLS